MGIPPPPRSTTSSVTTTARIPPPPARPACLRAARGRRSRGGAHPRRWCRPSGHRSPGDRLPLRGTVPRHKSNAPATTRCPGHIASMPSRGVTDKDRQPDRTGSSDRRRPLSCSPSSPRISSRSAGMYRWSIFRHRNRSKKVSKTTGANGLSKSKFFLWRDFRPFGQTSCNCSTRYTTTTASSVRAI